jgi:hypothetical protein
MEKQMPPGQLLAAAAAAAKPTGSVPLPQLAAAQLLLSALLLRVASFCRKAATLLFMGLLGKPWPDAAGVLVLLLGCRTH